MPLTEALERFFNDQCTSTVARLTGKRGKQMLKRAGVRAPAQPPSQPGEPARQPAQPPAQPAVTPPSAPPGGGAPAAALPPSVAGAGAVSAAALGAGALAAAGITAATLAAGTVTVAALAAALKRSQREVASRLGYPTASELATDLAAGLITMAILGAAFPVTVPPVGLGGGPAAPAALPEVAPGDGTVSPSVIAPEPTAPDPAEAAAAVDPTAIYDKGYWDERLRNILQPYYDSAASQASANVRRHLELPSDFDDASSLGAARALLEQRGNQTSPKINDTTYKQIVAALQEGVAAGEGLDALAKRINALFDSGLVRARRIAQTEVQAALNGSANAYANALPAGWVGSKRWLAHWPPTGGEDPRTRDAHRLAAGQTVPLGAPFYVEGFPMQYPGDPAAPAHLIINCRCALMFLPPGMDGGQLTFAAKNLHKQIAAANGVTLHPTAQEFVDSP